MARKIPLLQLLAATAARRGIETVTGLQALLKWPNDLVTPNGKIGGILLESKTVGENTLFAVVGVGINVNVQEKQLPAGATSTLQETGSRQNLQSLMKTILAELRSRIRKLDDPPSITEEWWRFCIHRPQYVTIKTKDSTVSGISIGIDEEGGLRLDTRDHKIAIVKEGTLRLSNDISG